MIEIGQNKTVMLRKRDKATRKLLPVLDPVTQEPVTQVISSEVTRVTRNKLGGHFGRDKHRKLVIKLGAGDVLIMWPQGTRQKVSIEIVKVYAQALRYKALTTLAEKARARKAAKAAARANARMRYAESKLRRPV